ncbi:MAG: cation diffusion facilitator family transporter [Eubacteriales bacterium]|nr:cation diffusion facilitator family transporter [Eubacteriales bacterium]
MNTEHTPSKVLEAKRTRDAEILRASYVGIAVNLVLASSKALMGAAVHSMAMIFDGVNNMSDALSSVITIAGTKFASKKPDKKHPLGHGRAEYLTSMIIAALVLYAGINSFTKSARSILQPVTPEYSAASLITIAAAILGKILLGRYVRRVGKRVRSDALVSSGTDALFDALLSAAVLFSALLFLFAHVNLEAWISVIISVFIIRAGVEMLRESTDDVLGRRLDPELVRGIRQTVCRDEDVLGAYDLILHSYGPEKLIGSVCVEVSDTMTATEIDRMERRISERVFEEHGVLLTGIGIYSTYHGSEDMRDRIIDIVRRHDGVLQIHGFFLDEENRRAGFDLVLDFELKNREEVFKEICAEVRGIFPEYEMQVTMDIDE